MLQNVHAVQWFTRYISFYRHVSICHCRPAPQSLSSSCTACIVSDNDRSETSASSDIAVQPSVPIGCSTSVCSLSSSQSTRDIKDFAAQFLLSLSSSSSMTLSQVRSVKESVSDLFSSSVDMLRQSAVDLLSNVACDPHDVKVRNFFDILDRLSKPFEDVDSTWLRILSNILFT